MIRLKLLPGWSSNPTKPGYFPYRLLTASGSVTASTARIWIKEAEEPHSKELGRTSFSFQPPWTISWDNNCKSTMSAPFTSIPKACGSLVCASTTCPKCWWSSGTQCSRGTPCFVSGLHYQTDEPQLELHLSGTWIHWTRKSAFSFMVCGHQLFQTYSSCCHNHFPVPIYHCKCSLPYQCLFLQSFQ